MKRFAFRFQRVLETKRHFEDIKKNEMAVLMAQRLEDEGSLRAIEGELLDRQRQLAGRAEAHETIEDVALLANYFETLAGQIRLYREQLERWDDQIETKREELVETKRETKVLEQLEQSDRRAYDKAVADWEQKLIDEVAAGRYVRAKHEEVRR